MATGWFLFPERTHSIYCMVLPSVAFVVHFRFSLFFLENYTETDYPI